MSWISKLYSFYVHKLNYFILVLDNRRYRCSIKYESDIVLVNLKPCSPFGSWLYSECDSESVSHSVTSDSLQPHRLYPARLLCPRDSPGKNTGVDSHFLLQGVFLTQGPNLGLLLCRQILYHLSHQERVEYEINTQK